MQLVHTEEVMGGIDRLSLTPVIPRRPAHVHTMTDLTAPLARSTGAPVGGMAGSERRLDL